MNFGIQVSLCVVNPNGDYDPIVTADIDQPLAELMKDNPLVAAFAFASREVMDLASLGIKVSDVTVNYELGRIEIPVGLPLASSGDAGNNRPN